MTTLRFILILLLCVPGLQESRAQSSVSPVYSGKPPVFIPYIENKVIRIPELKLPERCLNTILPPAVDNSSNTCFAGIYSQGEFWSCEQHHCVAYVFGYEINRLRGLDGKLQENFYPSHYTYNFFNNATDITGVSYFYSLDVLSSQGQMTGIDYGPDLASGALGWPSGYEKYYNGMHNRLGGIYTIPMNTVEGQTTLKHYLYDHLEGSQVGGVALFAAEPPAGTYFRVLPGGTPEAGKPVMIYFNWYATHGGTVIGYNDSIRYDINNDGKYTNDIDINGDGIVDIRDWEIGGFRIANSYGTSWGDQGFYYILYSAMALPYGAGGIQNSNVVILQPLANYQPLMTMKASFRTACRDHFSIKAGVSSDTSIGIPQHEIDFPVFNFQGGFNTMQGLDTIVGADTLEFGLDVTPLLSYIDPGKPARFFMIVDNRDSAMKLGGEILHLSFISYNNGETVYNCLQHNIQCNLDARTYASVMASPEFDKLSITTSDIPSFSPGQPYQQQLQSSGGIAPYYWSSDYSFSKLKTDSVFTLYPGTFPSLPNIYKPLIPLALPFSFPFSGKQYDSVWVNTLGLVSFNNTVIPYQFTIDDAEMLKTVPGIFPAFSREYFSGSAPLDSVCLSLSSAKAIFRWFMRVNLAIGSADNNMELVLYPDGRYEVRYGEMTNSLVPLICYSGWSSGDGQSYEINQVSDRNSLQSQSLTFLPSAGDNVFHISGSGLLTAEHPDSSRIYDLNIRVDDGSHLHDNKMFQISSGLGISYSFADGWDGNLNFNVPASLNLTVVNKTALDMQNLSLRLVCSDTAIRFQDSAVNINLLQAGKSQQINHAFNFRLASLMPDLVVETFTLMAVAGTRNWDENILLPVIAPAISVVQPDIIDGDNHHLDPGEVAEFEVNLLNSGHTPAQNLDLNLIPGDTLIRVLSAPLVRVGNYPPPGNIKYRFLVRASQYAVSDTSSTLSVKVTGDNIPEQVFQFRIPLGRQPLALACLSPGSVSLWSMQTALDSLQVPYDIFSSCQFDPGKYNAVFLLNGTGNNEHILTTLESNTFTNYLDKGGKLYMEGYSIWSGNVSLSILPYFKYTSDRVPAFFYTRFKGCSGSFADGMYFSYENDVNGSIYDLKPQDSSICTFENYDYNPHCIQVAFDQGGYKTIASLFEFGGLSDSVYPSTGKNLMQAYLDFFNVNLTGPFAFFHASKTNTRVNDTLTIIDDSYPNIVSWQWEFPGATPATSTEKNPVISYTGSGSYDITLRVSDGKSVKSLTRKNFINVEFGTGISEEEPLSFQFYPNPAKELVTIRFGQVIHGLIKIEIIDIYGNTLISKTTENSGSELSVNTNSLKKGLYLLKAGNEKKLCVGKLLIQ